jgi:hypothetical protein
MKEYLLNLLLFSIFAAGLSFWWNTLGIKPIALRAAQRLCDEMGVQLLDESIVMRRARLKRDRMGGMRVWRSFSFEFSTTGDARYRGRVEILGKRVMDVQLEPHRI